MVTTMSPDLLAFTRLHDQDTSGISHGVHSADTEGASSLTSDVGRLPSVGSPIPVKPSYVFNGETKEIDTGASATSLRIQLEALNLDSRGLKKDLKKRLSHFKRHGTESVELQMEQARLEEERKERDIEWVLVIDFEATCEAPLVRPEVAAASPDVQQIEGASRPSTAESTLSSSNEQHVYEIIEFPIALVHLPSQRVVSTFQTYVKPVLNPILSEFCTQLTGIQQSQVDEAPTFSEALTLVNDWLTENCTEFRPSIMDDSNGYANGSGRNRGYEKSKNPGKGTHQFKGPRYRRNRNWCIATDGRMDLEGFLTTQLDTSCSKYPTWSLGPYLESRSWFSNFTGVSRSCCKLVDQLTHLNLKFEGREHSGLSDALNIARVILGLCKQGAKVECNRYVEEIERGWMPGQNKKKKSQVRRAVDEID